MSDQFDDQIRDALRAEAEGVTADDALLERIRGAAAPAPAAWRRRTPWLLTAAAAAVVVIGAAVVVLRDDGSDQTVDLVDDTTSTTTLDRRDFLPTGPLCDGTSDVVLLVGLAPDASEEQIQVVGASIQQAGAAGMATILSVEHVDEAQVLLDLRARFADRPELVESIDPDAVPTYYRVHVDGSDVDLRGEISDLPGVDGTVSESCDDGSSVTATTAVLPPDPERPTLVALAREDGWLVTVDLTTGEERELYFYRDPTAEDEAGMTYAIDAVELSPDGASIYFSTCCEPAVGTTYRITVTGGEPELVAQGAYPRVSPDGRYLAVGAGFLVSVVDLERPGAPPATYEVPSSGAGRVAWSPDGTQLAFVDVGGAGSPQVRLLDWDGTTLSEAAMGKPDNPGSFVSWNPDGMLTISSGEPIADDRGLSQDASYHWLLWVDEAGVVREQAGQESGDRTPIEGVPEALAADW